MPTGYTHAVQDGEITTLPAFAMRCARAFGALIEMRDDPMDKKIPDKFKPSNYHAEQLEAANETRREVAAMTGEEIAAAATEDFQSRHNGWTERVQRRSIERERYQAMIEKTTEWHCPEACQNLKQFMLEQLRMSLDSDCRSDYDTEPTPLAADEWHAERLASAERDIEYHRRHYAEDVSRAEERNLWLDALRISLMESVTA